MRNSNARDLRYVSAFYCRGLSHTFQVPLDYSEPEGVKAAVAVVRFPSKYPVGHEKWRGPILYNPVRTSHIYTKQILPTAVSSRVAQVAQASSS